MQSFVIIHNHSNYSVLSCGISLRFLSWFVLMKVTWDAFVCVLNAYNFFHEKIKTALIPSILILLECPEKMVFPKKLRWNMIFLFLYYLERCYFFPKNIFFLWTEIFLKKYMEIWYFLYICINVTNILPFCIKNQRWSSPEKIHFKVIDILYCILELQQFSVLLWRPS